MDFKLNPYYRNVSEDDLISDIQSVRNRLSKARITKEDYSIHGKYSTGTIERRFGTWNKALIKAGLQLNTQFDISEEELFKNIEEVWTSLGRQPKYDEFKYPLSKYSVKPYEKRFGGWIKALQKFVDYINSDNKEEISDKIDLEKNEDNNGLVKHKTKREISERLRFKILMRDGFTCRSCGRSPIKERDVELHVDHIVPWSKGGETIPENLETKCQRCNLGKGDAFNI